MKTASSAPLSLLPTLDRVQHVGLPSQGQPAFQLDACGDRQRGEEEQPA